MSPTDPFESALAAFTQGDDAQAEAAARQMAAQGAPALARLRQIALAPALLERADLRWWAARALALFAEPEAEAALLTLLADPDPDLRACAIAGLGERRSERAVPALAALLADPSPYLARLAGDALIRIGQPAVAALVAALQDPAAPGGRTQAARALAHLQAAEAIPALMRALEDESALVAYWADEALDRLGLGMLYFQT